MRETPVFERNFYKKIRPGRDFQSDIENILFEPGSKPICSSFQIFELRQGFMIGHYTTRAYFWLIHAKSVSFCIDKAILRLI